MIRPEVGVGLEFVVKLPSEAGQAHGNAFPSGNAPSWLVWFSIHHSPVPAYRLRAKRENGCGCSNPGTLQAFSANQPSSRTTSCQETLDEWSRSGVRRMGVISGYRGRILWVQSQEYAGSPAIGDIRKVDRGLSLGSGAVYVPR